jgi:predicted enzyme related to lactoylglutathione lyase
MEKVIGLGGVFFRSRDPAALKRWYQDHLGVTITPSNYVDPPWFQKGGATVFEPFPSDTEYFGRREQAWMVNFRVRDLDAMVNQLREAGVTVEYDTESFENGRFARTHDPEGNPIELWEPSGPYSGDQPPA